MLINMMDLLEAEVDKEIEKKRWPDPTMRFTGSEIWKDACACVANVAAYFRDLECTGRIAC